MKIRNSVSALVASSVMITALTAATLPAVAADACTPGKTKKIAFMLKQQTAFRYLNADVPFFKKTAEAAGYEVLVQSAENDAQSQIAQAENVITQGVDAIVIQPVDFHVAAQIADLATAAHVPIASYDDLILGAKQTAFIGRDPKEGGMVAAKAITAVVPKGNYVLIGGDSGQTGSTQMQEGYHAILDPLVAKGDIKIVMDQFTPSWKTEPAQANAENALTQNSNDIQAFLVSYDGMSLGVLQAIEGAGIKAGSIPVTGQDMELSAAQAIVEGRQAEASGRLRMRWRPTAPRLPWPWRNASPSTRRPPLTMAPATSRGSRRRSTSSVRPKSASSSAIIPTG